MIEVMQESLEKEKIIIGRYLDEHGVLENEKVM